MDRKSSAPNVYHRPGSWHEIRFANMMALLFPLNHSADKLCQFFVRCPAAHLPVQIVIPDREKASAKLAVGSEADAAAVSAEGMRNRRDDTNFANSIVKALASCGLATLMRDLDQRTIFRHAAYDCIGRDHDIRRPDPFFFGWHALDEANDNALSTTKQADGADLVRFTAALDSAI